MIYLDNASTTPMSMNSLETYKKYAIEDFYNPSAIYDKAVKVNNDIHFAKEKIKNVLGVINGDIVFTSSATEANNLAIFGCLKSNFKKVVLSSAEHASVYNVGKRLEEQGIKVDYCPLQQNGEIDYDALEKILDESTNLISIIHVSNETGAINDLKKINEIRNRKCKNAILHADGVQAFSKINVNLSFLGIDMYTISSHKIFGPKGIACLYVKKGINLKPQIYGGGQENNIRSGTENIPAIMAFKTAVEEIGDITSSFNYVKNLREKFVNNLEGTHVKINESKNNSPYILSLCFADVNGETLVHMLEQKQIYISTGSACSSHKAGNRVLSAMSLPDNLVKGCIRVSFSKKNTADEVIFASNALKDCYLKLIDKLR